MNPGESWIDRTQTKDQIADTLEHENVHFMIQAAIAAYVSHQARLGGTFLAYHCIRSQAKRIVNHKAEKLFQ